MISQALVRVRSSILKDDFFKPIINAHFKTLYAHISDSWEDISKVYHRKNKDVALTLAVLKTLYLLNSWIMKTTQVKVERIGKKGDDLSIIFDPDTQDNYSINPVENYELGDMYKGTFEGNGLLLTIQDNSRDYDLIDDLSSNRGYMNAEDIKQDIISACLNFLTLCACDNLVKIALWIGDNGEYNERRELESDEDFYNILSPYPNNILKRRYDAVNKALHLRAAVPSYEDLPECEALSRMLVDGQGVNDTQALIELGIDFYNAVHPKKELAEGMKNPYLVYNELGPISIDIAAMRGAIKSRARSKNGRVALSAFFSSIGASKSTIAAIRNYGYIKVDDGEENLTYGKVEKKRPISLFSASAKAINKIGAKGAKLREHSAIALSDEEVQEKAPLNDITPLNDDELVQLKAKEKAREQALEAQAQAENAKRQAIRAAKKATADHAAPVAEETKRRGRPRKEPLKRGRGRPKGSVKVAK